LPEAQIDRFAVKLDVATTSEETLLRLVQERRDGNPPPVAQILNREAVLACQAAVDQITIPEAVARFIARLVAHTAPEDPASSANVREQVRYGASPRAAIWLARISRALALVDGRPGVGFEDVIDAAPHILGHRLILSYGARLDGITSKQIVAELIAQTEREILEA